MTIKRIEVAVRSVRLSKWERTVFVAVEKAERTINRGHTLVVCGRKQSIEQLIRIS